MYTFFRIKKILLFLQNFDIAILSFKLVTTRKRVCLFSRFKMGGNNKPLAEWIQHMEKSGVLLCKNKGLVVIVRKFPLQD